MSFQLQRTGEKTWDVLEYVAHSETASELKIIGRIVADTYAWYVERPVWQDIGHYFERIPRPFVTWKAAIKAATTFDASLAS